MLLILAVTGWLCLVITLSLLLRHFMRFIFEKTFSWKKQEGFIDLGEYATTWFAVGIITIAGFIVYKLSVAFLAYLFSQDLIGFFIMMRGVFSVESISQNPLVFEHLVTGLIGKTLLQLFALLVIYRGLRAFMSKVNEHYKSDTYQEGDLLYYGFFAVLLFTALEFFSYSQDIPKVSRTVHLFYLAMANTAMICYFLALSHIHLLRRTSYRRALPRYLEYDRQTKRIIANPAATFAFAWLIGIVLHLPLFLGTQFLENNVLVILFGLIFLALFIWVARKLLAKSFNYFGAVMFFDSGERIAHRSLRKLVASNYDRYLIGAILIILLFMLPYSFGLIAIVLLALTSLLIILHIFIYSSGLGVSMIASLKNNPGLPKIDRDSMMGYLFISGKSLVKGLYPSLLCAIAIFAFLSLFPKQYRNSADHNFINAVYDTNGRPIMFSSFPGNACTAVRPDDVPEALARYLQLQEDRDFLVQRNFWPQWSNWHGISLAALYRMLSGTGGGSNLNMQLIKNAAFSGTFPRDFQRKYTEMLASYQLSIQMEPEEIMVHYLNQVGMNGGIGHQGVVMAAYRAFDRPLKELNELEQLYLVATLKRGIMFKTDERYISYSDAPYHREEIKQTLLRQIRQWENQGLISQDETGKLKDQHLRFRDFHKATDIQVTTREFLKRQITDRGNHGFRYVSTLGLNNQKLISTALNQFKNRFADFLSNDGYDLYAAAIVVDVQTGNILGHYGGEGLSDLTTLSGGSPMGSVIKPFILLELMENQKNPSDLKLYDGKVKGRFTPNNYSRRYSNQQKGINEIISKSLNAPMVNVRLLTNPIDLFKKVEHRFSLQGIQPDIYLDLGNTRKAGEYEVNYPLGSRNMTIFNIAQLYQTLLNDGIYRKLSVFDKEYDPVLMMNRDVQQPAKRIYTSMNATIMKDAMHYTMLSGGTGTHISHLLPRGTKFYAKTGTSDEAIHGYTVLSDGEILIVSYVTYGKVTGDHLELNKTPPIPYGSGVRSAGVFAALLYQQFNAESKLTLATK